MMIAHYPRSISTCATLFKIYPSSSAQMNKRDDSQSNKRIEGPANSTPWIKLDRVSTLKVDSCPISAVPLPLKPHMSTFLKTFKWAEFLKRLNSKKQSPRRTL